eukprot:366562-Chlamydomonas_euryale.AAC.11
MAAPGARARRRAHRYLRSKPLQLFPAHGRCTPRYSWWTEHGFASRALHERRSTQRHGRVATGCTMLQATGAAPRATAAAVPGTPRHANARDDDVVLNAIVDGRRVGVAAWGGAGTGKA